MDYLKTLATTEFEASLYKNKSTNSAIFLT